MLKSYTSLDKLKKQALELERIPLDLHQFITKNKDISIIAEVKKASPSKGLIRQQFNPIEIAQEYIDNNVQAISVLTEEEFFQGSDEYLKQIKQISPIPILRKDFIIDEYQIYESYIIGADVILLIAAILENSELEYLYNLTRSLGMRAIIEVHNQEELLRVLSLEKVPQIIGINNRNLEDFTEDLTNTERLINLVPKDCITISESAIRSSSDMLYLQKLGINAILVGEMFMRSDSITSAIQELRNI